MFSVEICASPHLSMSGFNSQPLSLVVLIPLLNQRAPEYVLHVLVLQGSKPYAVVPVRHTFLMCEANSGKFDGQLVALGGTF